MTMLPSADVYSETWAAVAHVNEAEVVRSDNLSLKSGDSPERRTHH